MSWKYVHFVAGTGLFSTGLMKVMEFPKVGDWCLLITGALCIGLSFLTSLVNVFSSGESSES